MKWHFSPIPKDQVETEVTQRDQFNNDDVDISETIVREAIQNSLDAAVDESDKVLVTFRWVKTEDGLSHKFFKKLFDGHIEHAKAANIDLSTIDFKKPEALVIEDYGTTGLTGLVNEKDKDHFSDFWRRHGKSHKTGKKRGRWGLGKLVFSQTSRLGVFFGITLRSAENKTHLMGQTVLNLRTLGDKQYPPHGFFADIEGDDIYSRITVPIKEKQLVDDFISNFSLDRKDKPGLSVVIPFPDEDFNIAKMIEVAIGNYFYPIITGQLVVQFDDIKIDDSNIRAYAKQYAANRFSQIDILFNFVEEVKNAEQTDLHSLNLSWLDDKKLDADDFPQKVLEQIRNEFSAGKLVGVRLPVIVKHKDGSDLESGFSVYIKRPTELKDGIDLYVRGGLTLPAESKFRHRVAIGAMIAEDHQICEFLANAENAAHTKWVANAGKLRSKYRSSQTLVTAIKNSVINLYDLLVDLTEDTDEDALQSFFWFDEQPKGKKRSKKKRKTVIVPEIPRSKPKINLHRVEEGFTLTGTEHLTEDSLPHNIRVEVAYEVLRGNAFSKYHKSDFDLGNNREIKLTGNKDCAHPSFISTNALDIEIVELPFRLSIRGFDKFRDLKIRVRGR